MGVGGTAVVAQGAELGILAGDVVICDAADGAGADAFNQVVVLGTQRALTVRAGPTTGDGIVSNNGVRRRHSAGVRNAATGAGSAGSGAGATGARGVADHGAAAERERVHVIDTRTGATVSAGYSQAIAAAAGRVAADGAVGDRQRARAVDATAVSTAASLGRSALIATNASAVATYGAAGQGQVSASGIVDTAAVPSIPARGVIPRRRWCCRGQCYRRASGRRH